MPEDACLMCLGNASNSALIVAALRGRPDSEWMAIIKSRISPWFLPLFLLVVEVFIVVISLSLCGQALAKLWVGLAFLVVQGPDSQNTPNGSLGP